MLRATRCFANRLTISVVSERRYLRINHLLGELDCSPPTLDVLALGRALLHLPDRVVGYPCPRAYAPPRMSAWTRVGYVAAKSTASAPAHVAEDDRSLQAGRVQHGPEILGPLLEVGRLRPVRKAEFHACRKGSGVRTKRVHRNTRWCAVPPGSISKLLAFPVTRMMSDGSVTTHFDRRCSRRRPSSRNGFQGRSLSNPSPDRRGGQPGPLVSRAAVHRRLVTAPSHLRALNGEDGAADDEQARWQD